MGTLSGLTGPARGVGVSLHTGGEPLSEAATSPDACVRVRALREFLEVASGLLQPTGVEPLQDGSRARAGLPRSPVSGLSQEEIRMAFLHCKGPLLSLRHPLERPARRSSATSGASGRGPTLGRAPTHDKDVTYLFAATGPR